MGWWSCTVMGGDEPLDGECELFGDILELDMFETPFETIQKRMKECLEPLSTYESEWVRDHIMNQVLGVKVMQFGMSADDERVKTILRNARLAAQHDEWASRDTERKAHIDTFIRIIDSYDGTPTEIPQEGLFEVMEKSEEGLVNKTTCY